MKNVAIALYNLWNSFGIPAYVEENLPNEVQIPYITYTLNQPDWRGPGSLQVRVWYKGTGFNELLTKVDEISERIGEGLSIQTDSGHIMICKEDNFSQIQPFIEDSNIRVAYLNLVLYAHTK